MLLQLRRPLAFFDLETTGIRIGKDRIVQVGIVRLMPSGERERYQTLVNPEMPIPAEATAVHGISDIDVTFAPRLSEVADEILGHLADCDLSGFNVIRFDVPFLVEELLRVGRTWDTSHLRIVDAQRIFHKMERRDLSAALKFYTGREHEGAHDALRDVEATADVLLAQVERYTDLPRGVEGLGEFSGDLDRSPDPAGKLKFDTSGNVCLGFGKYSGWPLENIGRNDPGYLQWLMTKAELPASTLAVMKNVLTDLNA
jgi:DNA polymerase III subunit epsilon